MARQAIFEVAHAAAQRFEVGLGGAVPGLLRLEIRAFGTQAFFAFDHAFVGILVAADAQPVRADPDAVARDDRLARAQVGPQAQRIVQRIGGNDAFDLDSRNELIELLHDTLPRPPRPAPAEPWFPEPAPGPLTLLTRAAWHRALSPLSLYAPLWRALPKAAAFARDLLHPQHLLTATRFHAVVSPHRVFDTRRFAVDEFESIRSLVPGASLQDAVLTVCAGGLRRYLELHDELPGSDLSADVSEPGAPNNATDPSPAPPATRRVPLGTTLADPVERLAFIHAHTSAHTAAAPTQATQAARQLPPPCCNLTVVSSPVQPVYLVGARMTYFSALLPIADGLGLTFAISRYDDRIVISPTSCRELMPDPQAFTQGVRDCFQDLLALARRDPSLAAGPAPAKARKATKTPRKTTAKGRRAAAGSTPPVIPAKAGIQ